MAKTWTAAEAIVAMRSGDKSAIQDIGKRFPLFATFSQTEEGLVEIIKVLSFRVTARTIEAQLKEGVEDYKEDETATDEDEKPAKPAKPKGGKPKGGKGGRKTKPAEEEEDEVDEATDEEAEDRADLEEKKPKELVAIAEDLGLQKFLKSKKFVGLKGKKKKQALIDAIIAATPAEDAEEAAAEDEGDEDDWDI